MHSAPAKFEPRVYIIASGQFPKKRYLFANPCLSICSPVSILYLPSLKLEKKAEGVDGGSILTACRVALYSIVTNLEPVRKCNSISLSLSFAHSFFFYSFSSLSFPLFKTVHSAEWLKIFCYCCFLRFRLGLGLCLGQYGILYMVARVERKSGSCIGSVL
jgi:hypothetical protein